VNIFVSKQLLDSFRVNLGQFRGTFHGDHVHFGAHCSHQTRADVPRMMTKSWLVSIVMRTVLFVAKLASHHSFGSNFCGTFRLTFWLTF
jgi:hypothetical protein